MLCSIFRVSGRFEPRVECGTWNRPTAQWEHNSRGPQSWAGAKTDAPETGTLFFFCLQGGRYERKLRYPAT